MNDARLIRALAAHIGEPLTTESAARILAAAVGGSPVDLAGLPTEQCGRLTFAAERFAAIKEELQRLQPTAQDQADLERREARGDLVQFTARHDGKLVGHIRVFLADSLLGYRFSMEDMVYLEPAYRAGRNLPRFVIFCETCLRSIGVAQSRIQAACRDGLAQLAERLGYAPTHTVLMKPLVE